MAHTAVLLDNEFEPANDDLQVYNRCVTFADPATTMIPEGYMTSEEFWKEARKRLDILCKKYGII
jgi:hypothetical protein